MSTTATPTLTLHPEALGSITLCAGCRETLKRNRRDLPGSLGHEIDPERELQGTPRDYCEWCGRDGG